MTVGQFVEQTALNVGKSRGGNVAAFQQVDTVVNGLFLADNDRISSGSTFKHHGSTCGNDTLQLAVGQLLGGSCSHDISPDAFGNHEAVISVVEGGIARLFHDDLLRNVCGVVCPGNIRFVYFAGTVVDALDAHLRPGVEFCCIIVEIDAVRTVPRVVVEAVRHFRGILFDAIIYISLEGIRHLLTFLFNPDGIEHLGGVQRLAIGSDRRNGAVETVRPLAEVHTADSRVGRCGSHLVKLRDGDIVEGLVSIQFEWQGVAHQGLCRRELRLVCVEVEHGINHFAFCVNSGEVALDVRHPESHRPHELVGRNDILSFGILGGLYPQFADAGVVVSSQALDIGIVAVESHLHPKCQVSRFVIGLLRVGVKDVGIGNQSLWNLNSRGNEVGGEHVNAVQLGVAGNGHHNLLSLASPCGTVKGTCIGAVIVVPLAIVEHNLPDDLAGSGLEGQRAAIDAQLRALVRAPEAVGRSLGIRRNGQRHLAIRQDAVDGDVAGIAVAGRARLLGHGIEVEGGLGVVLDGEPEHFRLFLLAATGVDALDADSIPCVVV